jgi:RNA recognition motif-containing protein
MNGFSFPDTTEKIAVAKYHDNERFSSARVPGANTFKGSFQKKTNLFVNRVPFKFTEADVKFHFSKFGNIKSVKVKTPSVVPNSV